MDFSLPNRFDEKFSKVIKYSEILEDLIDKRELVPESEQELLEPTTLENILAYLNYPGNTVFDDAKNEVVNVSSMSFDPEKSNGLVKISVKQNKTPQSYVEKTIERFARMHNMFGEFYYPLEEGSVIEVSGHQVIAQHFRDVVRSGKDLYQFIDEMNPQFIPKKSKEEFKERLRALFPIDYTGVKLVLKSRDDVRKLVGNLVKNKVKNLYGMPILVNHYEDNISLGEKDCSVTLGIGDNSSYHGVSELKIISLADEINAEWGSRHHMGYKEEKRKQLEILINGEKSKYYMPMYLNGAKAFGFDPELVNPHYDVKVRNAS